MTKRENQKGTCGGAFDGQTPDGLYFCRGLCPLQRVLAAISEGQEALQIKNTQVEGKKLALSQ